MADFSKDNSKLPVLKFRRDNSSKEISNYPTYVLKHSVDNKNRCKIEKLFSCGDNGVFSSDRPCVLLLRNDHFYNVWGHDSLFDDVDNPRIGSKRKCGSFPRYKKLFCLRCIVSYANDHLHICKGRCHRCLGTTEDHETNDFKEFFCEDCGRCFCQESCFESHKTKKLNGGYETYCSFLHTLRTCNECRHEFSLSIKCRHFGKTNNKRQHRNIYFSNYSSKEYCGPSKYVKCGYCSDFYVKGFSGNHTCFLRNSDSIFGDVKKRSKTIHSHNIFYDIESRLEERLECRFQIMNSNGDCVLLRKSEMFNDEDEIENFQKTLSQRHLDCMEVVKCRSHQPTLLCIVNSSQSLKKDFCETKYENVVIAFFKWMIQDILKPMNSRRDQKNDCFCCS